MDCAHCNRPLGPRFEITRYDAAGAARGTTNVCSIVCLVQWSYDYGIRRGVQGVIMVKSLFGNLVEALKSVRG
jgi:hypothetical protein